MRNKVFHHLKLGIKYRPLFFISFVIATIIFILLNTFTSLNWATKILLSWNIAVISYLLIVIQRLWKTQSQDILKQAKQQDESKWIIFLLVMLSIVMCMISIFLQLNHLPQESIIKEMHLALAIFTVISAWFFMHTMFAIHYTHDFYIALSRKQNGGLDFPKTPHPTYPDFIYFSYVIGTSAQTADVTITSSAMRRLNTLHLLLAYGFNTCILAIIINIAAGSIG